MDPKTEAQHRRELADALDVVAEKFQPLNAAAAGSYRLNAEANRNLADELDPPQPAWQDGDLVRDRDGHLWQYDGDLWWFRGGDYPTEHLISLYGPIRKVRVADPAEQEVVVSLDGLDRERLDDWAGYTELSLPEAVARRVAKAAREQLGEVQ